jgi:hypothetical protein
MKPILLTKELSGIWDNMPKGLNIIERAKLTRRLQVNQRRLNKLDELFAGQPVGTAKFLDLSITLAKIAGVSADKITTGTLSVGEQIIINDGTTDRVLISREDIRISKPGVDVKKNITETNKKDFILLSLTELHKMRFAGFVTGGSYTHNLGKVPVFFAWKVDSVVTPTKFSLLATDSIPKATSTKIIDLPNPAYLIIFNEGFNP